MGNKKRGLKKLPYGFIAFAIIPATVLVTVFLLIPVCRAIMMSFTEVSLLSQKTRFVGLDNFRYMVRDEYFIKAVKNTFKIMLVTPLITISIAVLLAFIVSQCKLKEKNLYVVLFFLPNTLSSAVVAIMWALVYHPTSGILNGFLGGIGLSALQHTWLGDASTALWCIAATIIWSSFGYYMVLQMAGMDGISPEIYESAVMDGATFWDKLFKITLPLIKNVIGITFVMDMSGVLGASYTYSTIMTNGGPNFASEVLMKYIYSIGIKEGSMGYASALTVVMLVISVTLSIISRKFTERSVK
ncbi:MAG: sugar ABC transporter permease [Eubacteriales bacterium]|nr:sugar ABC transporter permease [Eubacteriales bacterium]